MIFIKIEFFWKIFQQSVENVKDMKNDIDIFRKEVDLMKDLVYGYEKETKDVTNLMKFQLSDVGKQMSHMKTSYKEI